MEQELTIISKESKGGIIWLEIRKVVAVIINHSHGVNGYVMVLHPSSRFGELLVVDMRCEECFLDIALGPSPLPLNQKFKHQRLHSETRHVIPLVDDSDYIKMDIRGPDILKVDNIVVPEGIKVLLQDEPLTRLYTSSLGKHHRPVASHK